MRVLLLTPRFPYPPDRGDTVRSWGVLRALVQRHQVWLGCVDTRQPEREHLQEVRRLCEDVFVAVRCGWRNLVRGGLSLLRGKSLTEGYFEDPRIVRVLGEWSQRGRFDAVLTYSSSIARLAEGVECERRILDLGDVDSAKWETYARRSLPPLRWLYGLEARRVARLERRVSHAHDVSLLVNERERRKYVERVPDVETGVLPTTVDLEAYPVPANPLPAEPVIGIVGSMFYKPNVRAVNWFGRHVWPLVQQQVPGARWLIVGSRPAGSVRRWGQVPRVTVTGYVQDVRPYLASMRVFVNAVDGDIGVQSKLVVAMATGRAAVVTPDTAAGVDYGDPPPFLIASAPAAFADAVVRLLRDDAQARALGVRARAVVETNYATADLGIRLERWLAGEMSMRERCSTAAAVACGRPVSAHGAEHEVLPI